MADVTFTVDGKKLTAPAGTLLIDACRKAGIEIPAFCYYPGLSLQAACRMCVVRQEKVPKLQTACTTTVAEGQVFITESEEIAQARKSTIQLLLGNHPLDCPVCDAGGECELQDMTFKYGAGESLYAEAKHHREEQQWSPAVYYDRPRCILCYRCVRKCGEGMDVWALGVENRGVRSVIAPNGRGANGEMDQLDCEQCGMCIDVCPVGALTSGSYRYKTRPWEMKHVSTVCTHCADGCKLTLGVRQANDGSEIVRADNRDKSGINNDFLCAKGRFGFDFVDSAERLSEPLVRNAAGKLEPATWEHALRLAAGKLKEVRDSRGGSAIAVIGSNQSTNEENYLLQKFARTILQTNNIDHERTTDFAAFARALASHNGKASSLRDIAAAPAVLLVGGDPTEEHPLLAWELRTNVRLNRARLYIANSKSIKLERQAKAVQGLPPNGYKDLTAILDRNESEFAKAVMTEESLVIVFGQEFRGAAVEALVAWGLKRGNVRFAYLGDHSNSRGAADMGLFPALLPGYVPVTEAGPFAEYPGLPQTPGKGIVDSFTAASAGELGALLIVGANPIATLDLNPAALKDTFVIVQDIFLTETAARADVVFPSASLYEKSGTVTNTFGDVQLVKKAADRAGVKPDFEILVRLAGAMGVDVKSLVPFGSAGVTADLGQSRGAQSGEADRHGVWLASNNLEPRLSPFDPLAVLDEIARLVPGYQLDRINLFGGNDVRTEPGFVPVSALAASGTDAVVPAHDTLFTSSTLGRYSPALNQLQQHQAHELAESAAD
ncbi:MAG: NADH-quinone oxidoreductase subunit NuoG [Terracidiphilus sp.]|nr:NADH-quinone oxidoreductase subunit NuoG [Terracidiphilus sp.]